MPGAGAVLYDEPLGLGDVVGLVGALVADAGGVAVGGAVVAGGGVYVGAVADGDAFGAAVAGSASGSADDADEAGA